MCTSCDLHLLVCIRFFLSFPSSPSFLHCHLFLSPSSLTSLCHCGYHAGVCLLGVALCCLIAIGIGARHTRFLLTQCSINRCSAIMVPCSCRFLQCIAAAMDLTHCSLAGRGSLSCCSTGCLISLMLARASWLGLSSYMLLILWLVSFLIIFSWF